MLGFASFAELFSGPGILAGSKRTRLKTTARAPDADIVVVLDETRALLCETLSPCAPALRASLLRLVRQQLAQLVDGIRQRVRVASSPLSVETLRAMLLDVPAIASMSDDEQLALAQGVWQQMQTASERTAATTAAPSGRASRRARARRQRAEQ